MKRRETGVYGTQGRDDVLFGEMVVYNGVTGLGYVKSPGADNMISFISREELQARFDTGPYRPIKKIKTM